MECIICLIVGLVFGVMMMCLLQACRTNAYIDMIRMLKNEIDHERVVAIKEKRTAEYINGMSRIYMLIKDFFKEELDNE